VSHQDKDCRRSSGKHKKQRQGRTAAKKQDSKPRYNSQYLQQALWWLLGSVNFGSLRFRDDCTWLPLQLAATALLWAWSDEATLGERFVGAHRLAEHLYQPQQKFAGTVQA
jgi:hypothetical protein